MPPTQQPDNPEAEQQPDPAFESFVESCMPLSDTMAAMIGEAFQHGYRIGVTKGMEAMRDMILNQMSSVRKGMPNVFDSTRF